MRLVDFVLAFFFGSVALVVALFLRLRLWQETAQLALLFIAIGVPVALLLTFRLKRPFVVRPSMVLLKIIFVLSALCLSLVAVMMSGFSYLTEDEPVLKLILTGAQRKQQVEWKQPEGMLRKENLNAYEVRLETPSGEYIDTLHVYGDQVAVKARVIRFKPILNVIGFPDLCKVEYVYNGYTTADRFNTYPHLAQELKDSPEAIKSLQTRFWGIWEDRYYWQNGNAWIKSATLESNYFPLVKPDGTPLQAQYFLTITSGGLSAVPLP